MRLYLTFAGLILISCAFGQTGQINDTLHWNESRKLEKYNASMTELTNDYNEFRKETKLGQDSDALLRWARKIKEGLNSLNDYR